MITFCHKAPASEDFQVTNSGAFILKRPLNYNLVQKYIFTVTAQVSENIDSYRINQSHDDTTTWLNLRCLCRWSLQDNGGLSDTATVLINVEDFDNLNPYFSHTVYQAFIPENQVSLSN